MKKKKSDVFSFNPTRKKKKRRMKECYDTFFQPTKRKCIPNLKYFFQFFFFFFRCFDFYHYFFSVQCYYVRLFHLFFFFSFSSLRSGFGGNSSLLVVHHVLGGGTKLVLTFHHFIHRVQEVLLFYCLPSSANSKHSRFGTNRA